MIASPLSPLDFADTGKVIISVTSHGVATRPDQTCYELKTPYSDGTTHVIFEPLDYIARLEKAGSCRCQELLVACSGGGGSSEGGTVGTPAGAVAPLLGAVALVNFAN
jgi:hypothetical protein